MPVQTRKVAEYYAKKIQKEIDIANDSSIEPFSNIYKTLKDLPQEDVDRIVHFYCAIEKNVNFNSIRISNGIRGMASFKGSMATPALARVDKHLRETTLRIKYQQVEFHHYNPISAAHFDKFCLTVSDNIFLRIESITFHTRFEARFEYWPAGRHDHVRGRVVLLQVEIRVSVYPRVQVLLGGKAMSDYRDDSEDDSFPGPSSPGVLILKDLEEVLKRRVGTDVEMSSKVNRMVFKRETLLAIRKAMALYLPIFLKSGFRCQQR